MLSGGGGVGRGTDAVLHLRPGGHVARDVVLCHGADASGVVEVAAAGRAMDRGWRWGPRWAWRPLVRWQKRDLRAHPDARPALARLAEGFSKAVRLRRGDGGGLLSADGGLEDTLRIVPYHSSGRRVHGLGTPRTRSDCCSSAQYGLITLDASVRDRHCGVVRVAETESAARLRFSPWRFSCSSTCRPWRAMWAGRSACAGWTTAFHSSRWDSRCLTERVGLKARYAAIVVALFGLWNFLFVLQYGGFLDRLYVEARLRGARTGTARGLAQPDAGPAAAGRATVQTRGASPTTTVFPKGGTPTFSAVRAGQGGGGEGDCTMCVAAMIGMERELSFHHSGLRGTQRGDEGLGMRDEG